MEKTVLDKALRTGQHLVLTYTQTSPIDRNGFTAVVDGVIVCEGFGTTVQRDAVELPDTPHVFEVPNIPGAPQKPGRFGVPVGLTTEEADHLEATVEQVRSEPQRRRAQRAEAARAAAPGEPTWELPPTGVRPEVGRTVLGADGRHVTIVGSHRQWTEDGPSFYLPDEQGYIYIPVVREATAEEVQHLEGRQDWKRRQRMDKAREDLRRLFVWSGRTEGVPDAEEATYQDAHPRGGAPRLHLDYGRTLVLTDEAIYSVTTPVGGIDAPPPFWRHPVTRERSEVFAVLAETDPWARVEYPVPRPVGRPRVGRQVTATLPEETIAHLDEMAEQQGRKRGQVLRDVVVQALERRERSREETL